MAQLKRKLSLFDVINLVVGTIVGADIYIAASFGAGFLGPASLIAWAIAGLMAIFIALSFAECSSILPKAGGPYVYAKDAFGDFFGFLARMVPLNCRMERVSCVSTSICCLSTIFFSKYASHTSDYCKDYICFIFSFYKLCGSQGCRDN